MKKLRITALFLLALCIGVSATAATFTPGVYEGEGDGRNGKIKVAVTLDDKGITEIKMTEHEETDGFWEKALEGVSKAIIDGQTLKVDAVASATLTSNGLLVAVAEALKAANVDPVELGYVPPTLPDPSEQIKETGANKEGVRNFEYTTQGNTCSTKITFIINVADMTVFDLVVYDGCDGNARGFSALADGAKIDDVIAKFAGILCHASDGSSCPDQVSKALNEARFIILGERLEVPANP
jgi:uncharacterized protein (TIGR03905 family)